MQTGNPYTKINRCVETQEVPKQTKDISAQPTFREESLEQAISEKLEDIREKVKGNQIRNERKNVYYRPPKRAQSGSQRAFEMISDKYQRRVQRKHQYLGNLK